MDVNEKIDFGYENSIFIAHNQTINTFTCPDLKRIRIVQGKI